MVRRISGLILAAVTILITASIVSQAQSRSLLTRHTREVVITGEAQSLGRLPATQTLQLDLMLRLRHQPELENFIRELYDPSSAIYRQYLTVEQFTERFGPSDRAYTGGPFGIAENYTNVNEPGTETGALFAIRVPVRYVEL